MASQTEQIETFIKILNGPSRNFDEFCKQTIGSEVDVKRFYDEQLRPRLLSALDGISSRLITTSVTTREANKFWFNDFSRRGYIDPKNPSLISLLFADMLEVYKKGLACIGKVSEIHVEMSFIAFDITEAFDLLKREGSNKLKIDQMSRAFDDLKFIDGLEKKPIVLYDKYIETMKDSYNRLQNLYEQGNWSSYLILKIVTKDDSGYYSKAQLGLLNFFIDNTSTSIESVSCRSRSSDCSHIIAVIKSSMEKKLHIPFQSSTLTKCLKAFFTSSRTTFVILLDSNQIPFNALKELAKIRKLETVVQPTRISETEYKLLCIRWENNYLRYCATNKKKPYAELAEWKTKLEVKLEGFNSKRQLIELAQKRNKNEKLMETKDRLRKKLLKTKTIASNHQPLMEKFRGRYIETKDIVKTEEMKTEIIIPSINRMNEPSAMFASLIEGPIQETMEKFTKLKVEGDDTKVRCEVRKSLLDSDIEGNNEELVERINEAQTELAEAVASFDLERTWKTLEINDLMAAIRKNRKGE